jgi:hypothetical protein
MKNLASKVAHNRHNFFSFQYCQPAQNQPKSYILILFHKNDSLRDFYLLTYSAAVSALTAQVAIKKLSGNVMPLLALL